jgi:RNA-dependent RNA polymerase
MEKKYKPKEAIYHSECILGQLYDKVESVNFVPQYDQPFDKRILRAYKLDDGLLKTVRQIKTQYDTYMRRIMAQHEIKTEFEVWSTFVLSRPRVGSDYKLQEEIGRISEDLKAQFRLVCIEKAGGKDFAVLGPFVAGMYKVTKEEMDIALAECRATKIVSGREVPKRKMEPKSMPLITFPWLFEKELGRIATGIDTSDDFEDLGLLPLTLKGDGHSRKRQGGGEINFDDFIQQEDGVIVHRGEELDLFRPDVDDSYDFSGESDYEEARSVRGEHGYKIGESGEVVLDATFNVSNVPEHLLSGTGVEEVVPRTELDGFVDPQVAAKALHETSGLGSPYFNDWQQVQLSAGSSSQRKESPSLGLIDDSDNAVNSHSSPHTDAANGNPLYPSMKDLALLEPEPAQAFEEEIIDEEVVDLDVGESPLEKLARMVGDESSGERPLSSEDEVIEVEEEIVDLEIEESPLEKLARKMDGQSASAEAPSVSQRDVVEESEEVVDVDVGESSLEKLARMMGS